MLIILHRGNVFGPLSCEENSEHTIRTIIETFPEFHMEIDLRVDFNGDLFLGHDTPEHRTSIAFLTIYQTNLWIHAKDVNALLLCLRMGWRCFSHDHDDFVLTSNGKIWTYPRAKTVITYKSIVVMPEYIIKLENMNRFFDEKAVLYGVCSDHAYALCCFPGCQVLPEYWLKQNQQKIESICRNVEVQSLDLLEHGRCMALFTFLRKSDFNFNLKNLQTICQESFPNDIC